MPVGSRLSLGALNWLGYTLFPGRVFGGDKYDPYTNTLQLHSDVPALVLPKPPSPRTCTAGIILAAIASSADCRCSPPIVKPQFTGEVLGYAANAATGLGTRGVLGALSAIRRRCGHDGHALDRRLVGRPGARIGRRSDRTCCRPSGRQSPRQGTASRRGGKKRGKSPDKATPTRRCNRPPPSALRRLCRRPLSLSAHDATRQPAGHAPSLRDIASGRAKLYIAHPGAVLMGFVWHSHPCPTAKLRREIAFEAARLMYCRQESEYYRAKLKAAKRLCQGSVKPADLPSNREIRDEIQSFARLHEGARRADNLRDMRIEALRVMRLLRAYRPRLIGSTLTGHVRAGSDIDIHVFADGESGVAGAGRRRNDLRRRTQAGPQAWRGARLYAHSRGRPLSRSS